MDRLWTRAFVLMSLGSLFLFTSFYLLLPTLPLFVKELGGHDTQVGLAVGIFTLVAVILRPIAGGLLDQYGRRPFLLIGLAFYGLSMYLYGMVQGVGTLLLVRLLHGASWAFVTTAAAAVIADIVPANRRGEGMGWYGLAMTVAMAAGPLLGTWTLDGYTFSGVFLLAVALTVAALLAVAGPRLPFQRPEVRRKIALYDPAALPVSLAVVFLTFAYGAVTTFVPLFAVTIDVNPGLYFLVYALSLTLARPIAGKLSDRYGAASVIVPAALLSICALFVLSSATGLAGVVAAAVLYGLGFGSAQPALQAALLGMVPKERFGLANASFFTAFDLGIALGSTLLGWVADLVSYRALFALSTLAVALSLAVFIAYVRPLLRRREGAVA
ncbi:MAG: MFS transporter [Firmicutes bacterium]|nr:MFS transporter [Bacillota bacterium]